MGSVRIFRKNKMKKDPLQKTQPASAYWWVDISTSFLC